MGRWLNGHSLEENSRRLSQYHYAYNNPIYFIDPDGMPAFNHLAKEEELKMLSSVTDINIPQSEVMQEVSENLTFSKGYDNSNISQFSGSASFRDAYGKSQYKNDHDYRLGKDGSITKVKDTDDSFDRIVKRNGNALIDNIAKGIIKDGMNLRFKDNVISVNGENQPTTQDVEDFALGLSFHVRREVAGTYLSKDDRSNSITNISLAGYEGNRYNKAIRQGISGALREGFGEKNIKGFFHTHPGGNRIASDTDRRSRNSILEKSNNAYFNIITKSREGEFGRSHRFNYTNN